MVRRAWIPRLDWLSVNTESCWNVGYALGEERRNGLSVESICVQAHTGIKAAVLFLCQETHAQLPGLLTAGSWPSSDNSLSVKPRWVIWRPWSTRRLKLDEEQRLLRRSVWCAQVPRGSSDQSRSVRPREKCLILKFRTFSLWSLMMALGLINM